MIERGEARVWIEEMVMGRDWRGSWEKGCLMESC